MIARKTWKEVRGMTFAYFLILELLLVLTLLYWPQLRQAIDKGMSGLLDLIPVDFAKRMLKDVMSKDPDFAYRAYIAAEQFFRSVNVIGISAAVLLGTGAIARERENGTLEFLFSRPVSRSRILRDKTMVLAASTLVPVFASSLSVWPMARLQGYEIAAAPLLLASLHGSLFILLFLMLTIFLSTCFKTQVHVAFAVGGFIVMEVGIFFVKGIREISLFRLSDYDVYMPILSGTLGFADLFLSRGIWLLAGIVVLYLLARHRITRIDL